MCCGADAPFAAPPPSGGACPPTSEGPSTGGMDGPAGRGPPPPSRPAPAPVFCMKHNTSEQRPKVEPQFRECRKCQLRLQTNYADFSLCPTCSQHDRRCMICSAPSSSSGAGGRGDESSSGDVGHASDAWGGHKRSENDYGPPPPTIGKRSDSMRLRPTLPNREATAENLPPPPSQGHADRLPPQPPRDIEPLWHPNERPPSPPPPRGMRTQSSSAMARGSQHPPSPKGGGYPDRRSLGGHRFSTPQGRRTEKELEQKNPGARRMSANSWQPEVLPWPPFGGKDLQQPPSPAGTRSQSQSVAPWPQQPGGPSSDGIPPQWMPKRGNRDR